MKVLVCGGRSYSSPERVHEVLDALDPKPTCLIVGDCQTGVDAHARAWARFRGVDLLIGVANWGYHDRSAGPRRNRAMLVHAVPGLVLAFPGGRGTESCVKIAQELGIEVRREL